LNANCWNASLTQLRFALSAALDSLSSCAAKSNEASGSYGCYGADRIALSFATTAKKSLVGKVRYGQIAEIEKA